jgi:hypothetical protein
MFWRSITPRPVARAKRIGFLQLFKHGSKEVCGKSKGHRKRGEEEQTCVQAEKPYDSSVQNLQAIFFILSAFESIIASSHQQLVKEGSLCWSLCGLTEDRLAMQNAVDLKNQSLQEHLKLLVDKKGSRLPIENENRP